MNVVKNWSLNIKIILSLLVIMPVISEASEAKLEKEIAKCATKDGDLKRLACYENLADKRGLSGPKIVKTEVTGVGKWRVSEKVNPVDDSKTVSVSVTADSGTSSRGESIRLVAICESNTTNLYISWNDYLGLETTKVLTRIGSNKAMKRSWILSSDYTASFYPRGAIGFLKRVMRSNKLLAQVTPYSQNPVTAVFDTTGLENSIKPLRKVCNW